MPMPLWFGHINKRIFNPREIRKGKRPVLTHVGRSSGTTFHTPLDAHPVEGGYLFILVYGSRSDWVQNVMATSEANLRVDGNDVALTAPRVVGAEEATALLPPSTKIPSGRLAATEFLVMDRQR